MNIDINEELKNIILKTKNLNSTFLHNHPNTKYSLDEIINEIIYFLKSGTSYRLFRSKISYKTIHYYYSKFTNFNIFYKLYNKIRYIYLKKYIINEENTSLCIDSTIVNNKFGINKIGRNKFYKNKNSTKISLMTDKNGFPLSILFLKGNYHDNVTFEKHIKDACLLFPNKKRIIIENIFAI